MGAQVARGELPAVRGAVRLADASLGRGRDTRGTRFRTFARHRRPGPRLGTSIDLYGRLPPITAYWRDWDWWALDRERIRMWGVCAGGT